MQTEATTEYINRRPEDIMSRPAYTPDRWYTYADDMDDSVAARVVDKTKQISCRVCNAPMNVCSMNICHSCSPQHGHAMVCHRCGTPREGVCCAMSAMSCTRHCRDSDGTKKQCLLETRSNLRVNERDLLNRGFEASRSPSLSGTDYNDDATSGEDVRVRALEGTHILEELAHTTADSVVTREFQLAASEGGGMSARTRDLVEDAYFSGHLGSCSRAMPSTKHEWSQEKKARTLVVDENQMQPSFSTGAANHDMQSLSVAEARAYANTCMPLPLYSRPAYTGTTYAMKVKSGMSENNDLVPDVIELGVHHAASDGKATVTPSYHAELLSERQPSYELLQRERSQALHMLLRLACTKAFDSQIGPSIQNKGHIMSPTDIDELLAEANKIDAANPTASTTRIVDPAYNRQLSRIAMRVIVQVGKTCRAKRMVCNDIKQAAGYGRAVDSALVSIIDATDADRGMGGPRESRTAIHTFFNLYNDEVVGIAKTMHRLNLIVLPTSKRIRDGVETHGHSVVVTNGHPVRYGNQYPILGMDSLVDLMDHEEHVNPRSRPWPLRNATPTINKWLFSHLNADPDFPITQQRSTPEASRSSVATGLAVHHSTLTNTQNWNASAGGGVNGGPLLDGNIVSGQIRHNASLLEAQMRRMSIAARSERDASRDTREQYKAVAESACFRLDKPQFVIANGIAAPFGQASGNPMPVTSHGGAVGRAGGVASAIESTRSLFSSLVKGQPHADGARDVVEFPMSNEHGRSLSSLSHVLLEGGARTSRIFSVDEVLNLSLVYLLGACVSLVRQRAAVGQGRGDTAIPVFSTHLAEACAKAGSPRVASVMALWNTQPNLAHMEKFWLNAADKDDFMHVATKFVRGLATAETLTCPRGPCDYIEAPAVAHAFVSEVQRTALLREINMHTADLNSATYIKHWDVPSDIATNTTSDSIRVQQTGFAAPMTPVVMDTFQAHIQKQIQVAHRENPVFQNTYMHKMFSFREYGVYTSTTMQEWVQALANRIVVAVNHSLSTAVAKSAAPNTSVRGYYHRIYNGSALQYAESTRRSRESRYPVMKNTFLHLAPQQTPDSSAHALYGMSEHYVREATANGSATDPVMNKQMRVVLTVHGNHITKR